MESENKIRVNQKQFSNVTLINYQDLEPQTDHNYIIILYPILKSISLKELVGEEPTLRLLSYFFS